MRILSERNLLVYLPLAAVLTCGCGPSEGRAVAAARRIAEEAGKGAAARPAITTAVARLDPPRVTAGRLKSWPAESVEAVRDAASSAAFYFPEDERLVFLEERALEEKLRRGGPGPRDLRDLFRSYMAARMFDKAKALRVRFPKAEFPSMPAEFAVAAAPPPGRPAYAVGADWRRVELTAAPLDRVAVVMSLFPGCPASEAATEDLLADPRTARVLRERSVLLTARFDAEGVAAWKKKFRLKSFYIARRASDFPEFSFDASPRFYFLKDGVVKSELTGWGGSDGPEGNRARWLAEFERAAR